MKNIASLLLLSMALIYHVSAAVIEFTPFTDNRYYSDKCPLTAQFGKPYTWPLKTFPHDWRKGKNNLEVMGNSYGCVYWPGEIVDVYIRETSGTVDTVVCVNQLNDATLPAVKDADNHWRITLPHVDDTLPLLELYRVYAMDAGGDTAASRGFLNALPWSGVQGKGDPNGPERMHGYVWHEWHNGVVAAPTTMCFPGGRNVADQTHYPWSERPWEDLHGIGLGEMYWWPRQKNAAIPGDADLTYTSDDYLDSTLEWNAWWTYYARGASDWEDQWQWGPFSEMSAEALINDKRKQGHRWRPNMMYGQARSIVTAMPNGLLFYQFHYADIVKMYTHVQDANGYAYIVHPSDGYGHWIFTGNTRSVEGIEGVGLIDLYYKRCRHNGLSTSWTDDYPSFGAFMQSQEDAYFKQNDRLNDFTAWFMYNDIRINNMRLLTLGSNKAAQDLTGKPVNFYGRITSAIDRHEGNGLKRDFTRTEKTYYEHIIPNRYTGGDYMHQPLGKGLDYFVKMRGYRGYGIKGALAGALFPIRGYGGGYNQTGNGCMMPGHEKFDIAYVCGEACNNDQKKYQRTINRYIKTDAMPPDEKDVLAYRRLELWEKLPMYYSDEGKLESWNVAQTGGWAASSTQPASHVWNSMILLGQQVLEIPDRVKPLGGVLILDSNNEEDRATHTEFLTEKSFNDYVCACMDAFGTATYARADNEKHIPADVPRIYAPRRDGGDQGYLTAKVGTRIVKVPYNGRDDQVPTSAAFSDFAAKVKDTYQQEFGREWMIQTTGGFAATAWQSSKDYFVFVESPMPEIGVIHQKREGSISVEIPGIGSKPVPVVDLCGKAPDPHVLPKEQVRTDENRLTFDLSWDHGDARVYWIAMDTIFADAVMSPRLNHNRRIAPSLRISRHGRYAGVTIGYNTGEERHSSFLSVYSLRGQLVFSQPVQGSGIISLSRSYGGSNALIVSLSRGDYRVTRKLLVVR